MGARTLYTFNEELLDKEYQFVFAADLMSDALAMINANTDSTILLTGLANAQSLRTAEMLDISMIIYVRGKQLSETDLELAKEMEFNLFSTNLTMFECSGVLYQMGMKAAGND
ncbi:MAG: hypothetical protein E7192_02190 [Erysipelotrichaceae bacterium]|nr:hypothetical protein [Erysipelotrichaceae bacterium]MBQ4343867.1 hypothetical protein [Erysipelotrichaceae bacterium]